MKSENESIYLTLKWEENQLIHKMYDPSQLYYSKNCGLNEQLENQRSLLGKKKIS